MINFYFNCCLRFLRLDKLDSAFIFWHSFSASILAFGWLFIGFRRMTLLLLSLFFIFLFAFFLRFFFFFFFELANFLNIDIDDIIKPFPEFSSQLDLSIDVFLKKVFTLIVGQSVQNDTGAILHHIIFKHELFNKILL